MLKLILLAFEKLDKILGNCQIKQGIAIDDAKKLAKKLAP